MANTYLPEWILDTRPTENAAGLPYWSRELGVSQQELRSALGTSINIVDTAPASERRRYAERRRDGRRRQE
jgi:hypothetical protein